MLTLPVVELLHKIRTREISVISLVEAALAAAQTGPGRAAYLSLNEAAMAEARQLDRILGSTCGQIRPLHGLPISVKDNYAVRGTKMTCGSRFYAERSSPARSDASFVARWRSAGAIIIGKTHLNEFAYGLTGENPYFGDLAQPLRPKRLTGGSSSGAAATVQGGMVCLGLGTDTGGSLRVPSALCELVGYRHAPVAKLNRGVFPLAPSFDTCGWIGRHLSDVPFVLEALSLAAPAPQPATPPRVGLLTGPWLGHCEPAIHRQLDPLRTFLGGLRLAVNLEPVDFGASHEIFARLQASEAARIHQPFLDDPACDYDPGVRARLEMGRNLKRSELTATRKLLTELRSKIHNLFNRYHVLIGPATPLLELKLGTDHTPHRPRLLELTAPFSLAGLPALTFPWSESGPKIGWQAASMPGHEFQLAALARTLSQSSRGGSKR